MPMERLHKRLRLCIEAAGGAVCDMQVTPRSGIPDRGGSDNLG